MPKYCTNFKLDPQDLCVIENALREVVHKNQKASITEPCENKREKARSLNEVLAKLHSQKIFYSQVNQTGIPAC